MGIERDKMRRKDVPYEAIRTKDKSDNKISYGTLFRKSRAVGCSYYIGV